jgi:beta-amylase
MTIFRSQLLFCTLIFTIFANDFTLNIMGPLHIKVYCDPNTYEAQCDWVEFDSYLNKIDQCTDAISVDVWWGDVEYKDNQFNWGYFKDVFSCIKAHHLKIIPIMSFHRCKKGDNPSDNYDSNLPEWLWKKYSGQKIGNFTISEKDLQYVSENGNKNPEYISLWVDDIVKNEYINFMKSFQENFKSFKDDIQEINISCGPAGELRFPAYSKDIDKWEYPHRGYFQAYSPIALQDFQKYVIGKFKTINNLDSALALKIKSFDEIRPPSGTIEERDLFFNNKDYLGKYGVCFINWYNQCLVNHGRNMLIWANESFNQEFHNIPLGIKIPGIHWRIRETPSNLTIRAAEITAGLISIPFDSSNSFGYDPVFKMTADVQRIINRKINIHFTCLEMENNDHSAPQLLVRWIGGAGKKNGVTIKGENALPDGMNSPQFWTNMENAIDKNGFKGLTILRLDNLIKGGLDYYKSLRQHFDRSAPK